MPCGKESHNSDGLMTSLTGTRRYARTLNRKWQLKCGETSFVSRVVARCLSLNFILSKIHLDVELSLATHSGAAWTPVNPCTVQ